MSLPSDAPYGPVSVSYTHLGIIAGLQIFERVFTLLDPETKVVFDVRDGEQVKKGQHLATVTGLSLIHI